MIPHLFGIIYLVQLVQGASTNTTSADNCPPLDETSRSLWSILGSCAVTLLVCIWHTIHFPVFPSDAGILAILLFKGICLLMSFFVPEVLIAYASQEWWTAYKTVKEFHDKGYEWSMTHSFFAHMGGFVYRDKQGNLNKINADDFLRHYRCNEITNPFVTVEDISDRSKSDWLGKAVLALQLVWFMLQVVVRGSRGLAITLVELDTVCLGVLSLMVIVLWWHKPLRPGRPHVFYSPQEAKIDEGRQDSESSSDPGSMSDDEQKKFLSNAWRQKPLFPGWLITCRIRTPIAGDEESTIEQSLKEKLGSILENPLRGPLDRLHVMYASLCVTWFTLGALHLVAWNYEFLTEAEKITWRAAALVLAGGSLAIFVVYVAITVLRWNAPNWMLLRVIVRLTFISGIVSRAVLVGLMLASLRALPCSAHQTVSWTAYIPHL